MMLRRRRLEWILRIRIRAHCTFSVSALPQKSPTDAFSLVNTIREADSLVIWDSRALFWLNIYFCEEKRNENPELSQTQCSSTLLSAGVQAQRRHIRRKINKKIKKEGTRQSAGRVTFWVPVPGKHIIIWGIITAHLTKVGEDTQRHVPLTLYSGPAFRQVGGRVGRV